MRTKLMAVVVGALVAFSGTAAAQGTPTQGTPAQPTPAQGAPAPGKPAAGAKAPAAAAKGKTEVTWWGHAAFVVRTPGGAVIAIDPKLAWALRNRGAFPVDVNRAPREMLLRVARHEDGHGFRLRVAGEVVEFRIDDVPQLGIAPNHDLGCRCHDERALRTEQPEHSLPPRAMHFVGVQPCSRMFHRKRMLAPTIRR